MWFSLASLYLYFILYQTAANAGMCMTCKAKQWNIGMDAVPAKIIYPVCAKPSGPIAWPLVIKQSQFNEGRLQYLWSSVWLGCPSAKHSVEWCEGKHGSRVGANRQGLRTLPRDDSVRVRMFASLGVEHGGVCEKNPRQQERIGEIIFCMCSAHQER